MTIMFDKKRVGSIPGDWPIQFEGIVKANQALLHERKDIRGRKGDVGPPFTLGRKNRQGFRGYLIELEEQ